MKEIDFLLEVNSLGVITYDDEQAAINNIREWVLTPMNDIYGMPSWGNQFHLFRHYPANVILEMQIEAHIVIKLPIDIPSVVITGIKVVAQGIDDIVVTIGTPQGAITQKLAEL